MLVLVLCDVEVWRVMMRRGTWLHQPCWWPCENGGVCDMMQDAGTDQHIGLYARDDYIRPAGISCVGISDIDSHVVPRPTQDASETFHSIGQHSPVVEADG